jgi:2-keto-4-pentenoate hydratase/2-oxohepta-3-ene-1,7-dioic acid hydratase in catechol pathway
MKLFRFGHRDAERPGVELPSGERLDVSAFGEDYGERFFESGGIARLERWLMERANQCERVAPGARIAAAVTRPSKIVCVGMNYRDHAAEQGLKPPAEPLLFMKSTTALSGPYDDLPLPRASQKTDWEVELALVIGRRARYVEREHALEHVAGFVLMNDYSEREHQKERGGQFVKGKSADGFAPLGPLLLTPDELDFRNLPLRLFVNGALLQASNTSEMIFDVPALVSHISEFMTLLPGDVISTGTPGGVGMAKVPPRYLKAGDLVEYDAGPLGSGRQRILAAV